MARMPEFKMSEVLSGTTITLHVKVIRDWRYRLGLWVVRHGVRLMGCAIQVEDEPAREQ